MARLLGIILAASVAAPAFGQACSTRSEIISELAEKYGETVHGVGLRSSGSVLELFVSEKTGSWTIVITSSDGTSCAVDAGASWQDADAPQGEGI